MAEASLGEREFWERRADAWERRADEISSFSDAYGGAAIAALAPQAGERILDVGCGPGATTVELAQRVGADGELVGLDIAEGMIGAAKRRAERAGVTNARFVVADAGTDPLDGPFDGVFSRFGVMFFPDPPTAIANIAGALRPGGRLAWAVWGPLFDNPWMFLPTAAAAPHLGFELAIPEAGEPGPFSMADGDQVIDLLTGAGFIDAAAEEVAGERLITTAHGDDEIRMLLEVGPTGDAYNGADAAAQAAAVAAVFEAIEPHRTPVGWRLPGKGLVVSARRPA